MVSIPLAFDVWLASAIHGRVFPVYAEACAHGLGSLGKQGLQALIVRMVAAIIDLNGKEQRKCVVSQR